MYEQSNYRKNELINYRDYLDITLKYYYLVTLK